MHTDDRVEVTLRYEAVCESIFSAWIHNRLSSAGLASALSTRHCPEPYLDFSPADPGIVLVTHNPGRGEEFQTRAAVDTATSPISTRLSYAENSRRLADWYAGHGRLAISPAACTRVNGMLQLGAALEMPGLRQVELFPLHSEKSPPDTFLFGTPPLDEPLRSYGELVRGVIATSPLVIGLCGSAPVRTSVAVSKWSRTLQFDLGEAECISLSRRVPPTVGMFVVRSDSRVAVLFCRQGSNGLPSQGAMPLVVNAIREALPH